MEVPQATLDILKCEVCGVQLSRGPVYIQHDGAALCWSCYTPETKATRNVQYEALAQLHVFPCKNKDLGCEDKVPFVQGGEVIPHEEMCEHRQWVCPVLGSARCDWLGPRADLLQHCEDQHQDLVLQSPCTLQHNIRRSSEKTYLFCALQVLFLLHVKMSVAAGKLYHAVRYLGRIDEAKDFSYTVEMQRSKAQVLREGEVAPQGCLAIQEDTSLSLDINSLLSVLGGFDGAMFTVEVQRRVRETRGVCAECDTQAQGCSYQDIDDKCWKHGWYFCEQRTTCDVCYKDVERGSLSAHRSSACREVYKVGATWRATQGGGRRLVSGAAGISVCGYVSNDAEFDLCVYIPVSSERLRGARHAAHHGTSAHLQA